MNREHCRTNYEPMNGDTGRADIGHAALCPTCGPMYGDTLRVHIGRPMQRPSCPWWRTAGLTVLLTAVLSLPVAAMAAGGGGHDHQTGEEAGQAGEAGHGHGEEERGAHGHGEGQGGGHGHGGHEEEEGNRVHLSPEQMRAGGIEVAVLEPKPVAAEVAAAGEVMLNAYATTQVTPRIEAQVVERHARLGEHVREGQPLVTLSSVAMAEAQGDLVVKSREWRRVKRLGRKVVSERRYIEAQVAFQQAHARLLAYGMSPEQVQKLADGGRADQADGRFSLASKQAGTVIKDDFVVGQMVQPGDVLYVVTDEAHPWVEARVAPQDAAGIAPGNPARIQVQGQWLEAKVIQVHHTLDERTRTQGVRLEVPNPDDALHPGMFVNVRIQAGGGRSEALTLPTDAVLRSPDGDWQVFVEKEAGELEPVEVEIERRLGDRVVIAGLAPGVRVVTKGAFFVQSELAKSGFEIHNH